MYGFVQGFSKGLLKKVLSFGSIIVTIIATKYFTPVLSNFVKDVTNIESTLTSAIYEALVKSTVYDSLSVEWVQKSIDTGNIAENLKAGICTNIANAIINLGCGIVIFIVVLILIKILLKVLDVVDYIPFVGQINKILGGVFGVLEVLLITWVVFTILKVFENFTEVSVIVNNIKQSPIVGVLYNNNFVYNFLSNLFAIFTGGQKQI